MVPEVRATSDPGRPLEATGAILAGGASVRMGRPKATLRLGPFVLVEWVQRALADVVREILLSVSGAESISLPGVRCVPDARPGTGPLAGLEASLRASRHAAILAVPCDLPFVSPPVLRCLVTRLGDADCVVPEWEERLHPLPAVYARRCLPTLERYAEEGRRSLHGLVERLRAVRVRADEIVRLDPQGLSFLNLNTPADHARALRILGAETRPPPDLTA